MHAEKRTERIGRVTALLLLGALLPIQAAIADETRWPDPEDLHEIKHETGDNPWLSGDHPPTPENRTNQWEQEPKKADSRFPDPDYSPYKRPERSPRKPRGEYLPGTVPGYAPGYPGAGGAVRRPAWGAGGYPPGYGYRAYPYGYPPAVPPPYWDDDGSDFPFFDGAPWDFDGFPFSPFSW